MIPNIYKPTTLDKLIRSKENRDELKGWAEAEIDFEAVCLQYKSDFSKLYEYMQTRFIQDGEQGLMQRLVKTLDEKEEIKILGQVKRMRQLHKKFMKYAANLQN
jgi:hypothetical protein